MYGCRFWYVRGGKSKVAYRRSCERMLVVNWRCPTGARGLMNGAGAAGEVGKRRGMAWAGFILSRGTDPTAVMDRGGRIVDRCDEAVGASGSYLQAETITRPMMILDESMCSRLVEKSARYRDCRQGARMSV